jgi:hypothetical protein
MLPKRIQIDLKQRFPRKHLLQFGGAFLLLREPSFSHLELVASYGFEPLIADFLRYTVWTEEDLPDILEVIRAFPVSLLIELLGTCKELFACDDSITEEDCSNAGNLDLTGSVRTAVLRAQRKSHMTDQSLMMNHLLEMLGVIVKVKDPQAKAKTKKRKDQSWIPLTQIINPKGFEEVQNSLELVTDEDREILELQEEADDLVEFGEKTPDGKTKKSAGKISLMDVMDKNQYAAYILQKSSDGFLSASKDVDMRTYQTAAATGLDPIKLAKRQQKLKENVQVKGRWRGKSG